MRRRMKTVAAAVLVASTLSIAATSNAQDLVRKPTTQVLTRTPPAPVIVRTPPAPPAASPVVHILRPAPAGSAPHPQALVSLLRGPGPARPAMTPLTPAARQSVMRHVVGEFAKLKTPGTPRDPIVVTPGPGGAVVPACLGCPSAAPVVANLIEASPSALVTVYGAQIVRDGFTNVAGRANAVTLDGLMHGPEHTQPSNTIALGFDGLLANTMYLLECRIGGYDALNVFPFSTTSAAVEQAVPLTPFGHDPVLIAFQTSTNPGASFFLRSKTDWYFGGCTLHSVL